MYPRYPELPLSPVLSVDGLFEGESFERCKGENCSQFIEANAVVAPIRRNALSKCDSPAREDIVALGIETPFHGPHRSLLFF